MPKRNPYDPVETPNAYDLWEYLYNHPDALGFLAGYEVADPTKGERWCGTHRQIEATGKCPDEG